MQRDVGRISIHPDADALEALGMMQRTGSSRLLVTEGDRLGRHHQSQGLAAVPEPEARAGRLGPQGFRFE